MRAYRVYQGVQALFRCRDIPWMPATDHASLWGNRASGRLTPAVFASQPYEIPVAALTAWLIAHGCRADVFPPAHSWYSHSTLLVEVRRVGGADSAISVICFHDGIRAARKIYGRDYKDITRGGGV
jgi:hypothetical protein